MFRYKKETAFFAHVMERKALGNIVTTGKICGGKGRGRQKLCWIIQDDSMN